MKLRVKLAYLVVGCGLISLGFLSYLAQGSIISQLNAWLVLPVPQRFTELYFTNHRALPVSFRPGVAQHVVFTVHNLERETTAYHYQLIARSADNGAEQILSEAGFTLAHGRSRVTSQAITLPVLGSRVEVNVRLTYFDSIGANHQPRSQIESIHYWVGIADSLTSDQKSHESS